MLKKLDHKSQKAISLKISDSLFPKPFESVLEYNPPVHGTWNIVHIGMQVPEAHQIYVCAENCMRGVVMTADEMGMGDRFSCVTLSEYDMLLKSLDDKTVEGICDVIEKLGRHPPMVMVFLVCVHIYLGSDEDYIYRKLGERYPDIFFARCYMDPISQRTGPTPEQKLRESMFDPIKKLPENKRDINILGCDIPLGDSADVLRILRENGFVPRQLGDLSSFDDFLSMGSASLNICHYPTGDSGVKKLSKRLDIPYLYLSPSFSYDEISDSLDKLKNAVGIKLSGYENEKNECDECLSLLKDILGDTPVSIDYTAVPRPLSLARLLIEHSFNVKNIYLEFINDDEEKDFIFLKKNCPSLPLCSTVRPELRMAERPKSDVLAIGQKAAYYENTSRFVNIVEGGGLWGFGGIKELCRLMGEAFREEKDTRDIVMRKGLGCPSVCAMPERR
ncbi:MAG: nitrogenase component 1 [Clostridiales bacterium]|nr:nitrogenase component 1 [Clostridiales bacterium]